MEVEAPHETLQFALNVPFRPQWRSVELLRTSVLNCLATIFESYDFCEQLGMTTAELLENAIGYGTWAENGERPLRLVVRGNQDQVEVEVTNPIREGPDLARLLTTVRTIEEAESPRAAYLARMVELASDPSAQGSRLGLLRIVFETGAQLGVGVSEDQRNVSVRATIHARHPSHSE
jgi:hypothetical protein